MTIEPEMSEDQVLDDSSPEVSEAATPEPEAPAPAPSAAPEAAPEPEVGYDPPEGIANLLGGGYQQQPQQQWQPQQPPPQQRYPYQGQPQYPQAAPAPGYPPQAPQPPQPPPPELWDTNPAAAQQQLVEAVQYATKQQILAEIAPQYQRLQQTQQAQMYDRVARATQAADQAVRKNAYGKEGAFAQYPAYRDNPDVRQYADTLMQAQLQHGLEMARQYGDTSKLEALANPKYAHTIVAMAMSEAGVLNPTGNAPVTYKGGTRASTSTGKGRTSKLSAKDRQAIEDAKELGFDISEEQFLEANEVMNRSFT